MIQIPDISEVLTKNPKVDLAQIKQAMEAIQALEKAGFRSGMSFDFQNPYRRLSQDDKPRDRRGVTLRVTRKA